MGFLETVTVVLIVLKLLGLLSITWFTVFLPLVIGNILLGIILWLVNRIVI